MCKTSPERAMATEEEVCGSDTVTRRQRLVYKRMSSSVKGSPEKATRLYCRDKRLVEQMSIKPGVKDRVSNGRFE